MTCDNVCRVAPPSRGAQEGDGGRGPAEVLFPQLCRQRRYELHQIGDHEDVGHLPDGGILVLVDGQDEVGFLHTGQMLDGAGDAAGDVELGGDGLAGGPDLVVVGDPIGIDNRTTGAQFPAKRLGR